MKKKLSSEKPHWSVKRLEVYANLAESDPRTYEFLYCQAIKTLNDNLRLIDSDEYRAITEYNIKLAHEIAIPLLQPYWDRLDVENDMEEVIEGSDGEE